MINCGRCSVDARSEEYPGYSLKPHCPPQTSFGDPQRAVQLRYLRCFDHGGVEDEEYGQRRIRSAGVNITEAITGRLNV